MTRHSDPPGNNPPALSSGRMGELHSRPFAHPPTGPKWTDRANLGESGELTASTPLERHLDRARLELRRVLQEHPGSNELDRATWYVLEAVRAITSARRALQRGLAMGTEPT